MKARIMGGVLLALALTGCASQTAGWLADSAQNEFATYQRNADAKVLQAENARLELELRLVRMDLANLFRSGALPPDEAAKKTLEIVMQKVNEREARLAAWHVTDSSAATIRLEMAAIARYHKSGIKPQDLLPALDQLNAAIPELFKPAPLAPTEGTHVGTTE